MSLFQTPASPGERRGALGSTEAFLVPGKLQGLYLWHRFSCLLEEAEARGTQSMLSLQEKLPPSVIAAASGQKAGLEHSEVPSHLKFSMTKAVLLKKKKRFWSP